jgi:hypothetical protein
LVNGTQNSLSDGGCGGADKAYSSTPADEQAKGTFFSEGKLNFEGSGALDARGNCNHAIVVDNDFEINNGTINVSESVNDGIHANEIIEIKGGILKISSAGDAIQSEKETGVIMITGGKIMAKTSGIKSHGLASEGQISINDATVQISVSGNGSKGIRSRKYAEFKGGKTLIQTNGTTHPDGDDESTPAGIRLDGDLYIEGGEVTVKSPGDKAKGINTHGNATIAEKYGTVKVDVDADDDALKVHGNLTIKSGTVSLKSKKKKALDVTGTYSKNGGNVTETDGGGF